MSVCYLIVAAFCFSQANLSSLTYEGGYSATATARYADLTVEVVDSDNIRTLDRTVSPQVCAENVCAYYHQFCGVSDGVEWCRYQINRSSRQESLSLYVSGTAANPLLPADWRSRIDVVVGDQGCQRISLQRFEQVSATEAFPRELNPYERQQLERQRQRGSNQ